MGFLEYNLGDLIDGTITVFGLKEGGVGRLYFGSCQNRQIKVVVKTLLRPHWENHELARRWPEIKDDLISASLPARSIDIGEYLFFTFFREARLVCQSRGHPNLIRGNRLWWTREGQPFYECEFVDNGRDLHQLRALAEPRRKRVSILQALHVALSVTNGMIYVGEHMIAAYNKIHQDNPATFFVHRDIKPENILVDQSNTIKIVDLGLAKFILEKTTSFFLSLPLMVGTIRYMSPEQKQHFEGVMPSSDIYSLGVVLSELLGGEQAIAPAERLDQPPRLNLPGAPPEAAAILGRCLHAQMNQRYQGFRELKADLIQLVAAIRAGDVELRENLRCLKCGYVHAQGAGARPAPAPPDRAADNGHVMTLIPAGPGRLGFTPGQKQLIWAKFGSSRTMPLEDGREVDLPAFEIDTLAVTNRQFLAFVRATGYQPAALWPWLREGESPFPPSEAERPVVNVSFKDAQAYCQWLGLRLPTGDEWEKAARGMDGRLYPWGNDYIPELVNSAESRRGRPLPVDSLPGGDSPYGCRQMVGNVMEWVDEPHPQSPDFKYLRGGCWAISCEFLGLPGFHYLASRRTSCKTNNQEGIFGFRCVRPPRPPAAARTLPAAAEDWRCPVCGGDFTAFDRHELRPVEQNIFSWVGFFDVP